jgi:small-conductance mechanosensitive channel
MTRDRIAGIGFHHPDRNARPLTKRKLAVAHLLMTAVLVICIVVAVTAVAIVSARAETLSALAHGREGVVPLALLIGLLLAGMGGIAAVIVRKPQPAGRNRSG